MSKLIFIFVGAFVIKLLFFFVPDNDIRIGYLFSDMSVSLEYYIYSIFEKLFLIMLAYIIANEATEYRFELKVFLWLMAADLVDMLLTYNSIWFKLGDMPISINTLSITIFGLVILHAWMKKHITEF